MITVECVFEKYIYRDENSGYSVFVAQSKNYNEYKNKYGFLCFSGKTVRYTKGMPLQITGTPAYTPSGLTIKITDIKLFADDKEIAVSYLSGGGFKGIGRKTAESIVNVVGTDIFTAFQHSDILDILAPYFTKTKIEKIQALAGCIRDNAYQLDVYKYISNYGGTYSNTISLVSKYGHDALNLLKQSPYKVGHKAGLSFPICDSIAKSNNIHPYDTHRLTSLLFEAFRIIGNKGDTYATLDTLYKTVNRIIKTSAYTDVIPAISILLILKNNKSFKELRSVTKKYSLHTVWTYENESAKNLKRLKLTATPLPFNLNCVSEIEKELNIKYSSAQKRAFSFLSSTGVKIITGGPGTGKSTVVKGLIAAYKKVNPSGKISLCAPTGRAAQRLTETTGMPACTIHRLLEFMPYNDEYMYKNLNDPIDADFIIVDEMSMVDAELFSILIGAIKNNTLLLLCGDIDQLPSVGPGNVLRDIINSGKYETEKLDVIFRQGSGSSIVCNAAKVKSGLLNLQTDDNFKEIYTKSDSDIVKKVSHIIDKCIKNNSAIPQILTPYNKGEAGTYKLNQLVQEKINKCDEGIHFGQYIFKPGDKIMTTRNNYSLNYFNGDTGTIISLSEEGMVVSINEEEILLTPDLYEDVSLAYAVSVYKSQGAEYENVLVVVPEEFKGTLQRNLIYTAITRAKTKVAVIYANDSLTTAVANNQGQNRKTLLCNLLNEVNF